MAKRKNFISQRDVARKSGVSQPAVSQILNEAPDARNSEETRERVLSVARELGYQ